MKVLSGQTLFDIAIQSCGSIEAAFELAVLNGLNLTDELVPGQELALPEVVNSGIVTRYSNKGINPSTADNEVIDNVERVFFEELDIEFS